MRDDLSLVSGRRSAPAVSATPPAEPPAPPPFEPYRRFIEPVLFALARRDELQKLAQAFGAAYRFPTADDQRAGQPFRHQLASVQTLEGLVARRELAALKETLDRALEPVSPAIVLGAAAVIFSAGATMRPLPENYVENTALELKHAGLSRGATVLAFRDAALSPERRFGPPETAEIIVGASKRQAELDGLSESIRALAGRAPSIPAMLADIREAMRKAAEAQREREAANERMLAEYLLDELRAGREIDDRESPAAKIALAQFEEERAWRK